MQFEPVDIEPQILMPSKVGSEVVRELADRDLARMVENSKYGRVLEVKLSSAQVWTVRTVRSRAAATAVRDTADRFAPHVVGGVTPSRVLAASQSASDQPSSASTWSASRRSRNSLIARLDLST